jgi:hypothetical protein
VLVTPSREMRPVCISIEVEASALMAVVMSTA